MRTIKIKQGAIRVSSAYAVLNHDDVVILHVDCSSKYPSVSGYSGATVYLDEGEYTIKTDESQKGVPTEVVLEGLEGKDWTCFAEAARYSVYITYFKENDPNSNSNGIPAWWPND